MFGAISAIAIARILSALTNFLWSALIVDQLGLSAFGNFSFFMVASIAVAGVCLLGLDVSILKIFSNVLAVLKPSLRFNLLGSLIFLFSSLAIFICVFVGLLFPGVLGGVGIILFCLVSVGKVLEIFLREYCRARELFKVYALAVFSSSLLFLIMLLIARFSIDLSEPDLAVLFCLSIWITVFIVVLSLSKKSGSDISGITSFEGLSLVCILKVLRYSMPFYILNIISIYLSSIDSFILRLLSQPDQLGAYSLALKFGLFVAFPLMLINSVAAPKLARFYMEENVKEMRIYARAMTFISGVGSIFTFSGFILVLIVLDMLDVVEDIDRFFWVFIITSGAQVINGVFGPVGYLVTMTTGQTAMVYITLAQAFCFTLFFIILVPGFGALGASIGYAISLISINLASYIYARKRLKISNLVVRYEDIVEVISYIRREFLWR